MKLLAIDGHPAEGRLSSALLDAFLAATHGLDITRINLRDIPFDPVLHEGYSKRQDWEPGLRQLADEIEAAGRLVMSFPMWWGAEPALVKGFFDRVLLPGFAFKYRDKGPFWDRLLAGRAADIIITGDTPRWFLKFAYGDPIVKRLKGQVFGFCGYKPVRIHYFGPVRNAAPAAIKRHLARAASAGKAAG